MAVRNDACALFWPKTRYWCVDSIGVGAVEMIVKNVKTNLPIIQVTLTVKIASFTNMLNNCLLTFAYYIRSPCPSFPMLGLPLSLICWCHCFNVTSRPLDLPVTGRQRPHNHTIHPFLYSSLQPGGGWTSSDVMELHEETSESIHNKAGMLSSFYGNGLFCEVRLARNIFKPEPTVTPVGYQGLSPRSRFHLK